MGKQTCRLPMQSVVGGERINDLRDFGDFRNRDSAQLCMFADRILTIGKIDAKGGVRPMRTSLCLPKPARCQAAQS